MRNSGIAMARPSSMAAPQSKSNSAAMRPKSIVFLGTAHDNGGSSILATNLAEVMRAEGHHVEEWYLFDSDGHHPAGTRIFVKQQRARSPLTLISLFARVVIALWRHKPDAVYGLQSLANLITGIGGRLAGIRNRIPTYHSAIVHQNAALMKVDRVVGNLGFYTRVITCAETVAETFVPNGPAYAKRLTVVVNGQKKPSTFARDEARRELGLSPNDIFVGQIGRFDYQKNQSLTLDLIKDLPGIKLALLGAGPDEAAVKAAIAAGHLENRVQILKAIDHARIGLFYAAVDAIVFPSRFEGLSLAAIEALHAGVPLVCSDIPSFREMFRDSSLLSETLLVPLNDRARWLTQIRAVLSDATTRARVVGELARLSPSYSFDSMAKKYLAVIDQ